MARQNEYVNPALGSPDTLAGKPNTPSQLIKRMMVLYHLTYIDLYMLIPLEGEDVESWFVLGSGTNLNNPFGTGVHGGRLLMPGTTVLVLTAITSGYVDFGGRSPVHPIISVLNEIPAGDTMYYPPWRILPSDSYDDYPTESAIMNYQGVSPTDRLFGKPVDLNPGDWEVGNPLKGSLYVGGTRLGMEASPVASLHMYPTDSTVVFNKGLTYVGDQPWRRDTSFLGVDGLSIEAKHSADTVKEALGYKHDQEGVFKPDDFPASGEIGIDPKQPRWSDLDYRGFPVSGKVEQRVAERDDAQNAQPAVFSLEAVDGTVLKGGMNSMTLMRSPDLPYLEMLRELGSEEPAENAPFTSDNDPTADGTGGQYSTQYADLLYEQMKKRFVDRFWARQKARSKDWKALGMEDTRNAMERSRMTDGMPIMDDDAPAYKNDDFEMTDPLGGRDLLLSKLESYIHLSPTGAIVISDGTGSEIRMEGGNIILSPAGDLRVQPGRDLTMTIPRFLSIFARKRVDLASDQGEVAIHAAGNATLSSEGVTTVESRAPQRVADSAYDKRDEGGGGVIIRSATDTHVLGSNVRVALQGPDDKGKTGVKAVPDGMLILEAGDSPVVLNGRTLSMHSSIDASLSVGTNGVGLMLGREGASLSGKVFMLPVSSVIFGGSSTIKWIDSQSRSIQEKTMTTPENVNMSVKGNIIASKGIVAQSILGSRGLFRALSSFNGRETESLFVPQKLRDKYSENINVYADAEQDYTPFTVDLSSNLVTNWFTRNASNPLLTADGVRRLGIYYPKSSDYHQDSVFWTMSRWQRLLATSGYTWNPTPVKDADGNGMLPLPGMDGWKRNGFVKGWNDDGTVNDYALATGWVVNTKPEEGR